MISRKLAFKSFQINGSEFGALFLGGKLHGCIGVEDEGKDLSYIPCEFCSRPTCEMKTMLARA